MIINRGIRLLQARGINMMMPRTTMVRLTQNENCQLSLTGNVQMRYFASKKGKKSKKSSASSQSISEEELSTEDQSQQEEQVATPTRSASTQTFSGEPFSVGDIKVIESTPDHQPPTSEDTIEGRYAAVLFSCASREQGLFKVYEDMRYLELLYDHSEPFKQFVENQGNGSAQVRQFTDALQELASIQPVTVRFIEVLAENKKLVFIKQIAQKYQKLYALFNKEEKITIISAAPLTKDQEAQVLDALRQNPENQGKDFQLEFTVDGSIVGGLQMYTESEFMDMSLQSRMTKIQDEISKLTE